MKRLVLFDVDGTLVRGGPAKEAFRTAMVEVFGTPGPIEAYEFSGKTDPQIARELLLLAGIEERRIDEGFPELWRLYLRELEARLPDLPMEVLPGVEELLDALGGGGDVALGLVTGNIVDGARLKLGSAGLMQWFGVGGYGSDHEERNLLPAIAIRRARSRWGIAFDPRSVVIVGDTPLDVECGRHGGTRTVAVATGRFGPSALEEAGADRVFEDLRGVAEVVGAILE